MYQKCTLTLKIMIRKIKKLRVQKLYNKREINFND